MPSSRGPSLQGSNPGLPHSLPSEPPGKPMYLCVCVCVCVCMYIYTCMCIYIHACVYMYMYN